MNVLVVYKKSSYKIYFQERRSSFYKRQQDVLPSQLKVFKLAHKYHYETLEHVKSILKAKKVRFKTVGRGRRVNFRHFDLVVTVGGDGTFLETARHLTDQLILGVNSDPHRSVGKFCAVDKGSFSAVLDKILRGRPAVKHFNRFDLTFRKRKDIVPVLNEILVCHRNPAAMSRYILTVNKTTEEQRSSGLWVSTAVGSSGAIRSAGGVLMKRDDKRVQYLPRELYCRHGRKMKLTGGLHSLGKPFIVQSLMREGVIFVDGEHVRFEFSFGEAIKLKPCGWPLKVVSGGLR